MHSGCSCALLVLRLVADVHRALGAYGEAVQRQAEHGGIRLRRARLGGRRDRAEERSGPDSSEELLEARRPVAPAEVGDPVEALLDPVRIDADADAVLERLGVLT